jgi:hypothetical protein
MQKDDATWLRTAYSGFALLASTLLPHEPLE